MNTLEILAPTSGTIIPLEAVKDEVFSAGILGPGVAIDPQSDTVVAPISGQIVSVLPHAYGIRAEDGTELLIHIGLETVSLNGKHFKQKVTGKVLVKAGEELTSFNRKKIAKAGYDTSIIIVVTNANDRSVETLPEQHSTRIQTNDVMMKVMK